MMKMCQQDTETVLKEASVDQIWEFDDQNNDNPLNEMEAFKSMQK